MQLQPDFMQTQRARFEFESLDHLAPQCTLPASQVWADAIDLSLGRGGGASRPRRVVFHYTDEPCLQMAFVGLPLRSCFSCSIRV